MKVEGGKFTCDACGRRFAWKPQLAGKKARCSCGATMVVPQAQAEAKAPPDEPDDLYDIAEAPPAELKVMRPVTAPAATFEQAGALDYRSAPTKESPSRDRFSPDEMTEPVRDRYIPAALSMLGLLGIIAWAVQIGADDGMVTVVVIAAHVATAIKTAILIGAAFMVAPALGVSFGEFRTAVLKFAAIVVFTDAVGLWFDEFVEMLGGYPRGRAGWRVFFIQLCVITAIISAMCYYLFDMDGEETGMFAFPFTIASQVIGFLLYLILGAMLEGMAAGPAPVVAAGPAKGPRGNGPAVVAPAPAPPMAAPGIPLQATDRDRQIERMIGMGGRMMQEANEYNQSQPQRFRREPDLVNQFYAAGAKRVYFGLGAKQMIIHLPDDPGARARCFSIAQVYHATQPQGAAPAEQGRRFLELTLAPPPSR